MRVTLFASARPRSSTLTRPPVHPFAPAALGGAVGVGGLAAGVAAAVLGGVRPAPPRLPPAPPGPRRGQAFAFLQFPGGGVAPQVLHPQSESTRLNPSPPS